MFFQAIDVEPISGALGAVVSGVDIAEDLSDRQTQGIHEALLSFQIICFRDQSATPERPALGSMLYALEVPDAGGDTMFANRRLACEALSDGMKELLERLVGVNSSAQNYCGGRAKKMKQLDGMKDKFIETSEVSIAEHPAVRTHPETGHKSLHVSRAHTVRFKGMTGAESRPLIAFLFDHAVRPEFTGRLRWEPGTMVLWDNRCTQHFAINDYDSRRRRMHRVTLIGDRPA